MSNPPHYIRQWRKFRGLTQEQLAAGMGISNSYVTKIESGVRRYDQQLLEAAAKVLKCHAADLIVRDPTDPDGIWTIWDQLGAQERRQLVEIAKTFLAAKERA